MKKKILSLLIGFITITLASCGSGIDLATILSSVQKSFKSFGGFSLHFYDDDNRILSSSTNYELCSSFDDLKCYFKQSNDEANVEQYFCSNYEGYASKNHLSIKNTIVSNPLFDKNGNKIKWNESLYINPLKKLNSTMFALSTNNSNEYLFIGRNSVANAVLSSLTNHSFSENAIFSNFSILIQDETINKINISTDVFYDETFKQNISAEISLNISEGGTAIVPSMSTYIHLPQHDNLDIALNRLRESNYTLNISKTSVANPSEIKTYDLIATENAYYQSYSIMVGSEMTRVHSGYVSEGLNVCSFNSYDDTYSAYRVDTYYNDVISNYVNRFLVASEVFEPSGDNEFTLRNGMELAAQVFDFTCDSGEPCGDFIIRLNENNDIKSFSYTTDSFNVLGLYSNIGSSTSPIYFEGMNDAYDWHEANIKVHSAFVSIIGSDYSLPYVNFRCDYNVSVENSYVETSGFVNPPAMAIQEYGYALLNMGYIEGEVENSFLDEYSGLTILLSDENREMRITVFK